MASAIPFIAHDFHLSPVAMGGILTAFFVGYALTQIPGGVLADRYGPTVVLTASICWWSVMTALTGMASGPVALFVIRILFGLGEGPYPAASGKALSMWLPPQELGRATGIYQAATMVGAAVAPLFTVWLITKGSWRWVFYSLLIPGIALALIMARVLRRGENDGHHDVSNEVGQLHGAPTAKIRWWTSLQTPPVLWCAGCFFLSNMAMWGLMNWLPTYLLRAWGFSAGRMGALAAITQIAGALGCMLGGYISDRFFNGRPRTLIALGLFANAACTYLAATAPSGAWAVAALVGVFFFANVSSVPLFTVPLTVVPKDAVGGAYAVVNMAGQIAGVLSPITMGYTLELTGSNFHVMLYLMVGLTAAAIYPAIRIQQSPASVELEQRSV